jgi:RND family efflux transporter MFP subunit
MSTMTNPSQPGESSPAPHRSHTGRSRRTLLIALIALLVLLAIGIIPRLRRRQAALEQAEAAANHLEVVSAVKAQPAPPITDLVQPANMVAVSVASIYARSNGYIRERYVDIGTKVKAGQLLAVIETPEVDQELEQAIANASQAKASLEQARANLSQSEAALSQAKANLSQAQANEEIARITNTRWQNLVNKGVIPKQSADERRSDYEARHAGVAAAQAAVETGQATVGAQKASLIAAQAAVDAQDANVRRLTKLRSFERVVAPFDGVITERKVEKGDLITAGSGSDRNMFSIAQPDLLRIQVNVPQTYSIDIKRGDLADVTVQERPGETFVGKVVRTADALDPDARTLLTEVYVENKDGRLLPGMYSQVRFHLQRSHPVQVIPTDSLIINGEGMRVATLRDGKLIHLVPVQVGHDLGKTIEVVEGLRPGELVVSNPPDTLEEGQKVEPQVSANETSKK